MVLSDLSGDQIPDGKGAKVRIAFDDARSGSIELDVTAEEARAMGAMGRQVIRRGCRALWAERRGNGDGVFDIDLTGWVGAAGWITPACEG
jgi:hypothetical protein